MSKYYGVERSREYLNHYGVPGMRPGVRRSPEELERLRGYQSSAESMVQRANDRDEYREARERKKASWQQGTAAYKKARTMLNRLNGGGMKGLKKGPRNSPVGIRRTAR